MLLQYCECYGAGLHCTRGCACIECLNGNDLPKDEFHEIMARISQGTETQKIRHKNLKACERERADDHSPSNLYVSESPNQERGTCFQESRIEDGEASSESSGIESDKELKSGTSDVKLDALLAVDDVESKDEPMVGNLASLEISKDSDCESEVSSCLTPSTCIDYDVDSIDSCRVRWAVWSSPEHPVAIRAAHLDLDTKPPPQCRMGWDNDELAEEQGELSTASEPNEQPHQSTADPPGAALTACTLCPCSPISDVGFPGMLWHLAASTEC